MYENLLFVYNFKLVDISYNIYTGNYIFRSSNIQKDWTSFSKEPYILW
jgi:hypothetical protein